MTRRFRALMDGGFPYFVAAVEGAVVGYAYAGPYRPRHAYRFTVEDSIYVHPDYMGQGIGAALLPELITACEQRGMRQMIAAIGDSDNKGSLQLHRRFGFAEAGTVKNVGFKFGRWLDVVFMQRTLGAGSASAPE